MLNVLLVLTLLFMNVEAQEVKTEIQKINSQIRECDNMLSAIHQYKTLKTHRCSLTNEIFEEANNDYDRIESKIAILEVLYWEHVQKQWLQEGKLLTDKKPSFEKEIQAIKNHYANVWHLTQNDSDINLCTCESEYYLKYKHENLAKISSQEQVILWCREIIEYCRITLYIILLAIKYGPILSINILMQWLMHNDYCYPHTYPEKYCNIHIFLRTLLLFIPLFLCIYLIPSFVRKLSKYVGIFFFIYIFCSFHS